MTSLALLGELIVRSVSPHWAQWPWLGQAWVGQLANELTFVTLADDGTGERFTVSDGAPRGGAAEAVAGDHPHHPRARLFLVRNEHQAGFR